MQRVIIRLAEEDLDSPQREPVSPVAPLYDNGRLQTTTERAEVT